MNAKLLCHPRIIYLKNKNSYASIGCTEKLVSVYTWCQRSLAFGRNPICSTLLVRAFIHAPFLNVLAPLGFPYSWLYAKYPVLRYENNNNMPDLPETNNRCLEFQCRGSTCMVVFLFKEEIQNWTKTCDT